MDVCSPSSDRLNGHFDSDASGDPAASAYIEPHNRIRAGLVADNGLISQAKFSSMPGVPPTV